MTWKTFSLRGLWSAVSVLAVAVIGLAPGRANAAENRSDKYLEFRDPAYYDRGDQISVALHAAGLVLEFHNPHVAINNHNHVVEVHQTATGNLLHYRRGTINFHTTSATIDFGESQRYDNDAAQAAVALLDNGLVLEVHTSSNGMLFSRVGQPSTSDSAIIEWHPKRLLDPEIGEYSAIAANRAYAVEIHQCADDVTCLFYSVAEVGDLENSMAE
jgi:hypothetical protein